jgi:serine/threonine protein kinase
VAFVLFVAKKYKLCALCVLCGSKKCPAFASLRLCGSIRPSLNMIASLTSTRCPVCHALHEGDATTCGECGLIFASYAAAASAAPSTWNSNKQVIGAYTVERTLSRSGMGTVFLASDPQTFDRPVVLKRIAVGDDADALARASAEAQALAQLRHPAIPQIYGFFAEGKARYIAMEYIGGPTLEDRLSRLDPISNQIVAGHAYSLDDVLRWGEALGSVLIYLAAQPEPVIHHDIKPANVVLDERGERLYLVDFGAARPARQTTRLASYGTPGYAAPEQYRGASEPRSDVYALAATLYHLATDDDPSAHPLVFPQLTALGALGAVLRPALERDPAVRPDAAAFTAALRGLSQHRTARFLVAPDGSEIVDLDALVAWCSANWDVATQWLKADLPDQVTLRWGQTALADRLQTARTVPFANDDSALDQALCVLDPAGFGAEPVQLLADTDCLDFGLIKPPNAPEQRLQLHNPGPRCVQARIDLPDWLQVQVSTSGPVVRPQARLQRLNLPVARHRKRARPQSSIEPVLTLPPGTGIDLYMSAFKRPGRNGNLRSPIMLYIADVPQPLQIQARARYTRRWTEWIGQLIVVTFAIVFVALIYANVATLYYAWQP